MGKAVYWSTFILIVFHTCYLVITFQLRMVMHLSHPQMVLISGLQGDMNPQKVYIEFFFLQCME